MGAGSVRKLVDNWENWAKIKNVSCPSENKASGVISKWNVEKTKKDEIFGLRKTPLKRRKRFSELEKRKSPKLPFLRHHLDRFDDKFDV